MTGTALDEANNALLLERLRGVSDRRARYVCAAVYFDGVRELTARGETAGRIAESRQGGANGFGYDPYFVSDELGRAFSEVTVRGESGGESSRAGVRVAAAIAWRAPLTVADRLG